MDSQPTDIWSLMRESGIESEQAGAKLDGSDSYFGVRSSKAV